MVTIDITLIIQMVNIIILMFILNAVLYKPVLGILRKRREKMASMRDDVAKFEENASQRQEEVDKKMAVASGKAKAALEAARAEAATAGSDKLAAIKAEAEAMKSKKMAELKTQVATAKAELQAGLDVFSSEIAGKILGRSL